MVKEVWDEHPALILGSEPAQTLIGDLAHREDPLVTLARLRVFGARLVEALRAISAQPVYEIRDAREYVPLHRVRRADRRTALATLRSKGAIQVIAQRQSDAQRGPLTSEVLFDVPRTEQHLDGAANRCVTALSRHVLHRVRQVAEELAQEANAEVPSETRTALAPRWPARKRFLAGLADQFRNALAHHPFSDVTRPEVTAAGLNAASAHPLYARAHHLAWRILRMGFAGPPTDERLWISPTWEIYERWCFVKIGKVLREAASDFNWEPVNNHRSKARAAWRGVKGATTLELLLQPVFTAWKPQEAREWRSLSGERIPDLVLTRDDQSGSSLVVCDAKYRVNRQSVLEGMTSAHIYHDALRYRGHTPQRSLLLVPASGGAQWLEDQEFQGEHGVGVVALGPASSATHGALLESMLGAPA
jgi:hypothetical protein